MSAAKPETVLSTGSEIIDSAKRSWNFSTFLRIKPQLGDKAPESLACHIIAADDGKGKNVEIEIPPTADPGLVHNNVSGFIPFSFTDVFDTDATQESIFKAVEGMVSDCVQGINSTVLAYGQTGSGKIAFTCPPTKKLIIF